MLSALLAGRTAQFQNILCNTDGIPFIPGEGWIKSMTTISTPHNGSSLFDLNSNPAGIASRILTVAGFEMSGLISEDFFNFDLEQWDIHKNEGESIEKYLQRIFETLGETQDFSLRELTTRGAERFNSIVNVTTEDSTAYRFSFANEESFGLPYPDATVYVPDLGMNPALMDTSLIIGLSPPVTDPIHIGPRWRENDGIVNTESMKAPLTGGTDTYVDIIGTPQKKESGII